MIYENKEYEGDFRDNMKEGFGILKKDGEIYEGYFINNQPHGKGTLKKGGIEVKGIWENGVLKNTQII